MFKLLEITGICRKRINRCIECVFCKLYYNNPKKDECLLSYKVTPDGIPDTCPLPEWKEDKQ